MIVVDASALIDLLLNTSRAPQVAARALAPGETLHAPHLLDVEVAQVLRRYVLHGALSPVRVRQSLADLSELLIERYAHADLLPRVWQLRNAMTAYDAAYVTLAEVLDAPLLTCDARLARAHGHKARVELVA